MTKMESIRRRSTSAGQTRGNRLRKSSMRSVKRRAWMNPWQKKPSHWWRTKWMHSRGETEKAYPDYTISQVVLENFQLCENRLKLIWRLECFLRRKFKRQNGYLACDALVIRGQRNIEKFRETRRFLCESIGDAWQWYDDSAEVWNEKWRHQHLFSV